MTVVRTPDDVSTPSEDAERARTFHVDILGLRDTGVCHTAFFRDPDGNDPMLHHRYAERA